MARPERFELPTNRFEADYSIQLSYGRLIDNNLQQVIIYLRTRYLQKLRECSTGKLDLWNVFLHRTMPTQ